MKIFGKRECSELVGYFSSVEDLSSQLQMGNSFMMDEFYITQIMLTNKSKNCGNDSWKVAEKLGEFYGTKVYPEATNIVKWNTGQEFTQ